MPGEGDAAYAVTYIEVVAASAKAASASIRAYGERCRAADGNRGADTFEEVGRSGRFAVVEAWRDAAARDAAPIETLHRALRTDLAAPLDRRASLGLDVAPSAGGAAAATVHILTHVDVVPSAKDQGLVLLGELARASRREDSCRRFGVLQQDSRANHLTLVEAWADAAAFDAHRIAAHTRAFREKIAPLMGALYDERVYRALR